MNSISESIVKRWRQCASTCEYRRKDECHWLRSKVRKCEMAYVCPIKRKFLGAEQNLGSSIHGPIPFKAEEEE